MYSKLGLMALLALPFLIACSSENQPQQQPIAVTKAGTDCLAKFSQHFSDYADGKMDNFEINAFWECVADAVGQYERLTIGEEHPDRYRPAHVLRFLQKHFMTDTQIGPGLLRGIMELKRVLVGGTSDILSRQDLTELQAFLRLAKEISQDLNPHVRIIFFKNGSSTDAELVEAGRAISVATGKLGSWLMRHRQTYTFAQLGDFVRELDAFVQKNFENKEMFKGIGKVIDVVPPVKKILLSGSSEEISGSEWLRFAQTMGDGYHAVVTLRYAFRDSLNLALVRDAIPRAVTALTTIFERGARVHPGLTIPFSEFRDLFEALIKADYLSKEFESQSLVGALKWAVTRLLAGGVSAEGLSAGHLGALKSRMSEWISLKSQAENPALRESRLSAKFEAMIAESPPMEWDQTGILNFATAAPKEWTRAARTHLVWSFVLMNWVKESFVGESVDHVTKADLVAMLDEVLPVLQDFGWMKETESTYGERLQRESDLFTTSSNGDGMTQVHEATRYLAFIASALGAANQWIDKAGCEKNEAECVRAFGSDPKNGVFASLPRLAATMGATREKYFAYMRSVEETAHKKAVEGEYSAGSMTQTWVLLYYAETFVGRFDTDMSETITRIEAETAAPIFSFTLSELLDEHLQPEEAPVFFTFLVRYGQAYFDDTLLGGRLLWNNWLWRPETREMNSDRMVLISILNRLSKL